jgi:Holliday junction resolvasome RuvABC DNA-binding subunit
VAHLERVSGIGPKTMARLTPLLTTETPGATTKADAAKADTAADTPTDAGTHAP